jgi:hypothetical protein
MVHQNASVFSRVFCCKTTVAEKRRYTVSLPEHIAEEVERFAKPLGSNPSEYISLVAREWFARGCPPVTPEEDQLRKRRDSLKRGA